MKKRKDRNYGKGRKGRGGRISGKSVKIIKEIIFYVCILILTLWKKVSIWIFVLFIFLDKLHK